MDIGLQSIVVPTRNHSFSLNLKTTALLIIDMQNDFCHPEGFSSSVLNLDITAIRQIIPSIQKIIAWARQNSILVIYTRESHRPDLSDLTVSKKQRYKNAGSPIGTLGKMGRYLVQGEVGTKIIDELQPLESEIQIDKPAHSAFVDSHLELILHRNDITHLLIAGVTTECCVLSTYRHASDLGFFCLLMEDCCAAFTEKNHEAALEVVLAEDGVLGWVSSSSELFKKDIALSNTNTESRSFF